MKKTPIAILALGFALVAGQASAQHPEGHKGPGKHPGHMFEKVDTNKDGIITKEEFRAQGDKMFAGIDTNGDGKITKAESEAKHAEWKEKRAAWKAEHQGKVAKEKTE